MGIEQLATHLQCILETAYDTMVSICPTKPPKRLYRLHRANAERKVFRRLLTKHKRLKKVGLLALKATAASDADFGGAAQAFTDHVSLHTDTLAFLNNITAMRSTLEQGAARREALEKCNRAIASETACAHDALRAYVTQHRKTR
jgi:hypothetical protein